MSLGEWFKKVFQLEDNSTLEIDIPRPKPTLAMARHAPAREEFKAWRDDPVTRFAFAALRQASEATRELWTETTWATGVANPQLLAELRARADAYDAIEAATYEAFCEWLGLEPEPLADEAA